jgi:hypothetical protein
MAYNPNTHIISAPVSIYDLQRAVPVTLRRTNSSTGQVETISSSDLGVLCAAVSGETIPASDGYGSWTVLSRIKINKWAKFKPIKRNKIDPLQTSDRVNANYGITNIPTWTVIGKMANFWFGIDTSSTNAPDCGLQADYWTYERPTGGNSSQYRLTDFSEYPVSANAYGYFHNADSPIKYHGVSQYYISPIGNLRLHYDTGAQDPRTLVLSDLVWPGSTQYPIGSMHFGVLLRKAGTTTIYAVTQRSYDSETGQWTEYTMAQTLQMGAWVDIHTESELFAGNYEMFPFASSEAIPFTNSWSGINNGKFLAILEKESISIQIQYAEFTIAGLAAFRMSSMSTRLLYYEFMVTNTSYNINAMTANYTLTVFKSDGVTEIASESGSTNVPYGAGNGVFVQDSIDLAQYPGGWSSASSVRLIVTVGNVGIVFKRSSSGVTVVTDHA